MNILSKKYYQRKLKKEQEKINKEYEEQGLTDEILEKQIKINKKRNELGISDETILDNDGWAQ